MNNELAEKDAPMPAGVEAMTKQELWNWFHRSSKANGEKAAMSRRFFAVTTGLHPSYSQLMSDPWAVIEGQRKRMAGLELQMAQMQKGYAKKLKRALAKSSAALPTTGGEVVQLREALEIIAAQDSGVMGSTSRADCMAAIASAALRATHRPEPAQPDSGEGV